MTMKKTIVEKFKDRTVRYVMDEPVFEVMKNLVDQSKDVGGFSSVLFIYNHVDDNLRNKITVYTKFSDKFFGDKDTFGVALTTVCFNTFDEEDKR